jgi:methyltransferase family protein
MGARLHLVGEGPVVAANPLGGEEKATNEQRVAADVEASLPSGTTTASEREAASARRSARRFPLIRELLEGGFQAEVDVFRTRPPWLFHGEEYLKRVQEQLKKLTKAQLAQLVRLVIGLDHPLLNAAVNNQALEIYPGIRKELIAGNLAWILSGREFLEWYRTENPKLWLDAREYCVRTIEAALERGLPLEEAVRVRGWIAFDQDRFRRGSRSFARSERSDDLDARYDRVSTRVDALVAERQRRIEAARAEKIASINAARPPEARRFRAELDAQGENAESFANDRYGVDAMGRHTAASASSPHMRAHTPSRIELIRQVTDAAPITDRDVFFDVGSGQGKVIMAVRDLTGAECMGVEFDGDLCAAAKARASALGLDVEFRSGDARQADYARGTFFFFFNPFSTAIMREVLEKLEAVARDHPIAIFCYGDDNHLSLLRSVGWLKEDTEAWVPGGLFRSVAPNR